MCVESVRPIARCDGAVILMAATGAELTAAGFVVTAMAGKVTQRRGGLNRR
jgi:hypothetical protein